MFDGLAMRRGRRNGWDDDTAVLEAIYRKKAEGDDVVYVPGNHDYAARRYVGRSLAGIPIVREAEHVTADGRRLWIVHGDEHDKANAAAIRRFGGVFRPVLAAAWPTPG